MTAPTRLALAVALGSLVLTAHAQPRRLDRLPSEQLAVAAPATRVLGTPGEMRIAERACARDTTDLRRRIVEIAIQEWAFFGFGVVDQTLAERDDFGGRERRSRRRPPSWHDAEESARVAASIGGYWAATAEGAWILERQNEAWNGRGIASRWRDPWSAAFVSWVMCESGLGDSERFRRAIAHHVYIDQAIEARDDAASAAAFVAHDIGEHPIEPGDMLCSARRSAYRSIADRRRHLGMGVRSHCDIVVDVDAANGRVLAIGGNVRGSVRLKLLPAELEQRDGKVFAADVGGRRTMFAHLVLRAPSIGEDAFETSPTLRIVESDAELSAWLHGRLAGETRTADAS